MVLMEWLSASRTLATVQRLIEWLGRPVRLDIELSAPIWSIAWFCTHRAVD